MAKLNLNYYCGEDLYSDGDVEEEILQLVRSGQETEPGEDASFPVLYHLSRVRENILNWYPFREGADCLEIGSGCGAITGVLCDRLARVTSVELSRRRAEINYERHKELENLEIRVGNLNDMKFPEGFDYVILNGVFEYAMSFTPGDKPYETFLNNIKQLLKPEGIILIAIENRLGLKYFAGAPEDHTDGYFDGIRGYKDNRSVRTFSRGEWEALMRTCGLEHYRFYYPYPDYKFPKEIFTDEALEEQSYGRPAWNFNDSRLALFSETELAGALQREGVIARFANSFLIEMSRQPLDAKSRVEYVKLGTDRAEQFAIATVIREESGSETPGEPVENLEQNHTRKQEIGAAGEKRCARSQESEVAKAKRRVVFKMPVTKKAKRHIEGMLRDLGPLGTWTPLEGRAEGDGILYPYLEQNSLGQQAAEAVSRGDTGRLRELVQKAADICQGQEGVRKKGCELSAKEQTEFARVFGDANIGEDELCIAPANIDLILDNIFEKDGRYQVIDCEWVFDFPVPVSFLLWRAINELYGVYPTLEQTYPKKEFLEEYKITPEMAGDFWRWATYFTEQYVGANHLLKRSIPETEVSLEELRQKIWNRGQLTCALYLDTGKGFSQQEMLVEKLILSGGEFSVAFDLGGIQNVRALRFDPLEGSPCICRIDSEKSTVKLTAVNAAAREAGGDLFLTTDPIYLIKTPGVPESLSIHGSLTVLSAEKALQQANQLLKKRNVTEKLAFWKKR